MAVVSKKASVIGGGWKAVFSVMRYAAQIGPWNLWQALRSKNACKACAFGTGGQNGGLLNESRRGLEVCNKNIQAHLSDIRKGIPNELFFQRSIADLSGLSGKEQEDLGRLITPLHKKAGDKHYTPLSYEQALSIITAKFAETPPERSFFYASGRSSNEAAFLLQLFARLYGTNNINNCSYYCHQASGVGLSHTLGTGTATVRYEDLKKADCIFIFGANPASNHPRFVKALIQCRREGAKVIVVNPAREPGLVRFASPSDWRSMLKGGAVIASTYLQPHLGGDIAMLQGMAKWLVENNQCDVNFIAAHTEGFDVFAAGVEALSWAEIETSSGLTIEQISDVAKQYAQSKNVVFSWSMGLTHHQHGVANIETLVAVALMRGMVGKPGAGLLPLRGHSNIQGTGSMGFTPRLKEAVEIKLQQKLNQTLPQKVGLDTMACMEAADRGEIDLAFMLGGNLLASNPDTGFATSALNKIPFKVYINPTINMSHVEGVDGEVLVLPIKVRDEEEQATTQESMFNFVRLSNGGIKRFPQLMSEVELVRRLGEALINKDIFDFSLFADHQRIRSFISELIPGFGKLQHIDHSREEFHIEGRTLHEPVFTTNNGKGKFVFHKPVFRANPGVWRNEKGQHEFLMSSVRSEGQFNSIIFHQQDTYRSQSDRWVVLMHPKDMEICGYEENDTVKLSTDTGVMEKLKVKPFDVRRGNLLTYYPEANILIPKNTDGRSFTPGFKSVKVRVE